MNNCKEITRNLVSNQMNFGFNSANVTIFKKNNLTLHKGTYTHLYLFGPNLFYNRVFALFLFFAQVDDIFNAPAVAGYAGCQVQGFINGSVIFEFRVAVLYSISMSFPSTVCMAIPGLFIKMVLIL